MKIYITLIVIVITSILVGCTTGQATRTSSTIYQPTDSSKIEILLEKPDRPYESIGLVGSKADSFASDDAVVRAMQKEAAELGAHAIWMREDIGQTRNSFGDTIKQGRAVAIRWKDSRLPARLPIAVTPTSTTSTTPKEEQIIPKDK